MQSKIKKDINLILSNENDGLSKYAADFDYKMHDYVLATLAPFFKGGEAAELGSYKGIMTAKLANLFPKVYALELEPELCEELEVNTPENVKVINCDFTSFPEYREFTDIFSVHSLEHIEHHIDLLRHIKANKADDAHLYVVVPNGNSLSRHIAKEMGILSHVEVVTEFEKKIGHFHTFTLEKLAADLEAAGLKIVESGGIMPKIFSNGQYDRAMKEGIITDDFLQASFKLSKKYPDICASIYFVCR